MLAAQVRKQEQHYRWGKAIVESTVSRIALIPSVTGTDAFWPTVSIEPYSLTAEAKTDRLLYFISRAMMLNLLRHNPKVGYQIVRILSEDIFQMRKSAAVNKD